MLNPNELDIITQRLNSIEQSIELNQYEQSSPIANISFTDLTGSSTTTEIATAVNEIKTQFNALLAEMKRINFMQNRG